MNYADVDDIAEALQQNQIHTIISVLSIKTPEQRDAQINLIRAATKTPTVKRFTPSEFGTPREDGDEDSSDNLKGHAVKELELSGLEYTLFSHGLFMDYYGLPGIKSNMTPWVFAIDIANRAAGIPGSGDTKAAYTYSGDVAKFIVAALGMSAGSWRKHSVMVGERRSLNEILRIAESVRGDFDVKYDSAEDLLAGKITELPSHVAAYSHSSKEDFQKRFAGFGLAMEGGVFDMRVPENGMLLNDIFPDILPKSVEEVIKEGWT